MFVLLWSFVWFDPLCSLCSFCLQPFFFWPFTLQWLAWTKTVRSSENTERIGTRNSRQHLKLMSEKRKLRKTRAQTYKQFQNNAHSSHTEHSKLSHGVTGNEKQGRKNPCFHCALFLHVTFLLVSCIPVSLKCQKIPWFHSVVTQLPHQQVYLSSASSEPTSVSISFVVLFFSFMFFFFFLCTLCRDLPNCMKSCTE